MPSLLDFTWFDAVQAFIIGAVVLRVAWDTLKWMFGGPRKRI